MARRTPEGAVKLLRAIRWLAWGGVAALGFLVLATTTGWIVTDGPLGPRHPTGPAPLQIGGPFTLTDQLGRQVTERAFRGRPMAVFFGFTNCPAVCPTTLNDMTSFMTALGEDAGRMHWVFISVDAERDTPVILRDYLDAFDARIVGLTGTEEQISAAAAAFRVIYERVPIEGGYTMDHSASIFLLDAEGRFAGTIDYKEDGGVAVEKLRMLVARHLAADSGRGSSAAEASR